MAGTVALQATADSSTATPSRNDKTVGFAQKSAVSDVTTGCAKVLHSSCYPVWLSFLPEGGICWCRYCGTAGNSRFLNDYAVSE